MARDEYHAAQARPRRLCGALRMVSVKDLHNRKAKLWGCTTTFSGSSAAAAGHPVASIRCRGRIDARNPGPAELGPRIIRRVSCPDLCVTEGSVWSEKSACALNWRSAMRAEALRRDVHMACAGCLYRNWVSC